MREAARGREGRLFHTIWRRAFERVCTRFLSLERMAPHSCGEIVHHKEHLTPENINTPEIALGENNLELLCRDCHALAHASDLPTDRGLMFDEEGNLVERELLS